MFNNETNAPADDKSPWTQPGFIAAAAVIALLVLLGLILAVTSDSSPETDSATTVPPAAAPAPATANVDASICGLKAGSPAIPTSAPKSSWRLRGTLAVPSAPETYGPARTTRGVPSCFAHSPTGALFAMVNIQAAMSALAKEPGRYPIERVLRMIAAGPGRDALAAAAAQAPVAKKGTTTPGAQIAGFRFVRYEPGTAAIDIVFAGSRPEAAGYVHGQSTIQWEDGDWKLVLAQNGAPFDAVQPVANLSGYVTWRGV